MQIEPGKIAKGGAVDGITAIIAPSGETVCSFLPLNSF